MKILSGWGRVGAQVLAVGMMGFLAACGGGGSEGEDIGTLSGESVALDARESALSVSRRPSTPVYHVTDLGTLGGDRSEAAAINDRGQVTGNAVAATGAVRAFLYNGNGMVDLGVVPRPGNVPDEFPRNSIGLGINNRGEVVGWSDTNNSGAVHAFLYSGGTMQAPASMPAQVAFDINDRGQVVGIFAGITDQAFLWGDGVYQVLGTPPGGEFADAMAINAHGQVAGFGTRPRPASTRIDQHAFLYSDGSMRDLGTLGGNASHGFDVNHRGWVVGESSLPGDAQGHAFLHDGRRMRDLGSLGGDDASASGVNDAGQVVGSFTAGRTNHPADRSGHQQPRRDRRDRPGQRAHACFPADPGRTRAPSWALVRQGRACAQERFEWPFELFGCSRGPVAAQVQGALTRCSTLSAAARSPGCRRCRTSPAAWPAPRGRRVRARNASAGVT